MRDLLCCLLCFGGWVDPGGGRYFWWFGWFPDESFWVGGVGSGQDGGSFVADRVGVSVVDIGRCVQAQAAVSVLIVVPGEEDFAVGPGGLDRGEPGPGSRVGISGS